MCARHWRTVPKTHQDALWAAYRRGQEDTMTPSAAYLRAAAACVRAAAEKENIPEAEIAADVSLYESWAAMIEEKD